MKTRILTLPAILIAIFLSSGCLPAHKSKMMDARLTRLQQQDDRMENRLRTFQTQETERMQALQAQHATLKAEFKNLKEELQGLRGELQTTNYRLEQHLKTFETARDRTQQQVQNNNQALFSRINKLETYLGLETDRPAEKTVKGGSPANQTADEGNSSARNLYTAALQTFEQGEYPKARTGFKKLLENYPESKMCDNARFWIGESYYREKWYEKAILEYQKVIDHHPDGNKIPAALLKQGMAFHQIDDNTNARLVFKKLIRQYPDANETKIAKKELNRL